MDMINVLHVADKLTVGSSTIHGVTRLLSWWLPRFEKSRFRVIVCSLRGRDKAGQYLEERGIKVFYLGKNRFDPLTVAALMKLVRMEGVDILHLHGYGAWTFGRVVGMLCGIPSVVQEHMVDQKFPLYLRLLDRILGPATRRGIAVSKTVKEFMVKDRSIPEDRVETIYNGIPLDLFQRQNGITRQSSSLDYRTRLGIPDTHKVVGMVGRLHKIKGHTYFLEAARAVLDRVQNVTFVIAGDGELRQPLEDRARSLGIVGSVRFLGFCDDMPGLLSTMDIMVIASLSEGVPLTLFEAMAAGCAIVSTNVGGIPEVLTDEKTAFIVPSGDITIMSSRIVEMLRDDKLLTRMKTAACEDSARFDITKSISQIENTYREVLNT